MSLPFHGKSPSGRVLGGTFWDKPTDRQCKASRNYGQSAMQSTISRILVGLILAALAGAGHSAANETMTPLERVASAPKGDLKNPFTDVASVAEEGHKIYMSHDCGSCHGGGGGGMAAALTNEVWIYGTPTTRCSG